MAEIKIEVVYEANGGEEIGLYAEGHHDPAAFAAAIAEWRKGEGQWLDEGYIPEVPPSEVRHETWRNEDDGDGYVFRPASPGAPGAYPVTCFAFEGGALAAPPPPAPSPPETPAPVHYLARYAAGSFTACDPTIKDGWTPDPLAVTCEECRKVVRWRCEQVPAPETPATDWWERGFRAGIDAASREIAPGPYPSCCEAHECETKQAWHRRKNLQIRVEALRTPPASPASSSTDPATKEQP